MSPKDDDRFREECPDAGVPEPRKAATPRERILRHASRLLASGAATGMALGLGCGATPKKAGRVGDPHPIEDVRPCCDPVGPPDDVQPCCDPVGPPDDVQPCCDPVPDPPIPQAADFSTELEVAVSYVPRRRRMEIRLAPRGNLTFAFDGASTATQGATVTTTTSAGRLVVQVAVPAEAAVVDLRVPLRQGQRRGAMRIVFSGPAGDPPGRIRSIASE